MQFQESVGIPPLIMHVFISSSSWVVLPHTYQVLGSVAGPVCFLELFMVWADREVSNALGWRVAISCSSTPVSPGEGGLEFTQLLTKVGWCLFFFKLLSIPLSCFEFYFC